MCAEVTHLVGYNSTAKSAANQILSFDAYGLCDIRDGLIIHGLEDVTNILSSRFMQKHPIYAQKQQKFVAFLH